MQRNRWILTIAVGLISWCSLADATTDGVIGKWKTIDDTTGKPRSIVQLYLENNKLFGRVVDLFPNPERKDPNPTCKKCEGERADQPIRGMIIVEGLVAEDGRWRNGSILDPENGKEYKCEIWRDGDELRVRGYLLMLYRTQRWLPAS